jgi:hypothetical protein
MNTYRKNVLLSALFTFTLTCGWTQALLTNNGIPLSIESGVTVTVGGGFTNQNAGSVDNGGTFRVAGDFTNTATFVQTQGLVIMNGTTAAQSVSGANSFFEMEVDNTNGVNVTSGVQKIFETLTLTDGTFDTNDDVYIISNINGTANVAPIAATADITGDISMLRYIGVGATGWRFLTSAVSGRQISDWSDDFYMSGFPGSHDPAFEFTSIWGYDETVGGVKSNGWTTPTSSTAVNAAEGFWVWCGSSLNTTNAFVIDVKGPANKGTISKSLSYSASAGPNEDGWNLVGNPYPCTIDWESASGWTKTNIELGFWVWDTDNKNFALWHSTFGALNGGSQNIASSQAFWAKATGGGAGITFREAVKSLNDAEFKSFNSFSLNNRLVMRITGNGYYDESAIRFVPGAQEAFDQNLDLHKLYSFQDTIVPGIASLTPAQEEMAINSLPEYNQAYTIPLMTKAGEPNNYTLEFEGISSFPNSACILLEDLELDSIVPLSDIDNSYSCYIADTTKHVRFVLHFGKPNDIAVTPITCFGDDNAQIQVDGHGVGPWDYEWFDSNGNNIQTTSNSQSTDVLTGLGPGTYYVHTTSQNSYCSAAIDTIEIVEPSLMTFSTQTVEEECAQDNTGAINIEVNGGELPYQYNWSNGATSEDLTNLESGTYSVSITDDIGCMHTIDNIVLTTGTLVNAMFEMPDTIYLSENPIVQFNNTSVGNTFQWSFGDGDSSNMTTPTHVYTETGVYGIQLNAFDNNCDDQYTKWLIVLDHPEAKPGSIEDQITITQDGIGVNVNYNFSKASNLRVNLYNSIGQLIYNNERNNTEYGDIYINKDLDKGVYLIEIGTGEEKMTQKLFME